MSVCARVKREVEALKELCLRGGITEDEIRNCTPRGALQHAVASSRGKGGEPEGQLPHKFQHVGKFPPVGNFFKLTKIGPGNCVFWPNLRAKN